MSNTGTFTGTGRDIEPTESSSPEAAAAVAVAPPLRPVKESSTGSWSTCSERVPENEDATTTALATTDFKHSQDVNQPAPVDLEDVSINTSTTGSASSSGLFQKRDTDVICTDTNTDNETTQEKETDVMDAIDLLEQGRFEDAVTIEDALVARLSPSFGGGAASEHTPPSQNNNSRSHNEASSPLTIPNADAIFAITAVTSFRSTGTGTGTPPISSRNWFTTNPPSSQPSSHSPTTESSTCARSRQFVRWFCVLVVLVVIIPTSLSLILVVVLPGLLFLTVCAVVYYSCTRDTIPLPVLLRSFLFTNVEWNGMTGTNSTSESHLSTRAEPGIITNRALSLEELQAAITRRVCLAILPHDDTNSTESSWNVGTTSITQQQLPHGHSVSEADFTLVHEHGTLYFSCPLGTDDTTSLLEANDIQALVGIENDNTVETGNLAQQSPSHHTLFDLRSTSDSPLSVLRTGDARPKHSPFTLTDSEGKDRTSRDTSVANSCSDGDICDDDDDDNDSVHSNASPCRGTSCDICLVPYKVNDVLAWSNNPLCNHVYHSDCITEWMQASVSSKRSNQHRNRYSCPTCRYDFLYYIQYQQRQVEAQHVQATGHDDV